MPTPPHPSAVSGAIAHCLLFCLAIFSFSPPVAHGFSALADVIEGCDSNPEALQAISDSVAAAIARNRSADTTHIWRVHSICQQGDWGYVYVTGYWLATSQPLPSPSDIALVQLTPEGWETTLPEKASEYNAWLRTMPASLLPGSMKVVLSQPMASASALTYSGYALPYPAGQSAYVIKHWYPAVDFSIEGAGQGDTIRNAKGGTVVFVKDSSARLCGDPPPDWECWKWANALVIQTGPNEYAWYLHFAQNSIPDWIQEGVYVQAGIDIGQEGATGWARGPHLHFQVTSGFSCCLGSGDSRMPDWPFFDTYPIDFIEYSWDQLPWLAVSQNGSIPVEPPSPPEATPEPSPAQPAPADSSSYCSNPYTVKPGEWLYKIAAECHVTALALIAANPSINPDFILAGQQLNMPPSADGSPDPLPLNPPMDLPPESLPPAPPMTNLGPCAGQYVVSSGENLFRIAFNCGLTTEQMATVNGILYPYIIYPEQVLSFP